jgi:histidine triad (HIT) family protein
MNADCVFCGIARGTRRDHHVIAESESALAFMNANPAGFGHVLVIPKRHATDIWELPRDDGVAVWDLVRRVADAARSTLRPEGLNLFQANGSAGWQSVFHFHVHVVPRWKDDQLAPNWTDPLGDRSLIPTAAQRLRSALDPGSEVG